MMIHDDIALERVARYCTLEKPALYRDLQRLEVRLPPFDTLGHVSQFLSGFTVSDTLRVYINTYAQDYDVEGFDSDLLMMLRRLSINPVPNVHIDVRQREYQILKP